MTKKFKGECIKLNWNFQRGGGGGSFFLELHIATNKGS